MAHHAGRDLRQRQSATRLRPRVASRRNFMRILFTGGSSFTGYWFIKELASRGHEVVATFRRELSDYTDDLRRRRIAGLHGLCRPIANVSFGDDRFLELISEGGWDLLCCHGAEATHYNSPD